MNEGIETTNFRSHILSLFGLFDFREISVEFDSHPHFTGECSEPEVGRKPSISPCGGVKLYRPEILGKELTDTILSFKLTPNLDVYTLLNGYTLLCADSHFPFWAEDHQGGYGSLTIISDGSALLQMTQRSADSDDDTEYVYSERKPVKFRI